MVGKDLWHDEDGKKTEEKLESTYPGSITTPQAKPDHMWLTEAEWKSLIPAAPRQGDKFPVPGRHHGSRHALAPEPALGLWGDQCARAQGGPRR